MEKPHEDLSVTKRKNNPASTDALSGSAARLLLHVVRRLVSRPDAASVEVLSRNGMTTIRLAVHSIDFARVIGKDGRTAASLRAILKVLTPTSAEPIQLTIEAIHKVPIKVAP